MLALAVTAHLYPRLEAERFGAGQLTKVRAQAVSGRSCRAVAERLGLPARLMEAAPKPLRESAAALADIEHVLSDSLEAVIGACFLTFGFEETTTAVIDAFAPEIEDALENPIDFKSDLQERLARRGEIVEYGVLDQQGPSHAPTFHVTAIVSGREVGRGEGRSKKDAEQAAARAALAGMGE